MNLLEKYTQQLGIMESAQSQAIKDGNISEIREISLLIYQLCNAIHIEGGNILKQEESGCLIESFE